MNIKYQTTKDLPQQAVQELYSDAGWLAYTKDIDGLMRALANSLAVISAWDGEELVGLIRVVGDGQSILYIQDILVRKSHKRCGIGSELLNQILEEFRHVRQKVLLTDESPETRGFYEANGFQSCDKGETVAFARFN
ncbi:MAG: GNAT family N-acetyltransferase [Firmicutes bacterium]|nr:GNAT family N-acetyltransferase [Bacillota bacterium]